MAHWKATTEARYEEMLGIPTEITAMRAEHLFISFLVGEPSLHRFCRIERHKVRHAYLAFAAIEGRFFESGEPLTLPEFKATTRGNVLGESAPSYIQPSDYR